MHLYDYLNIKKLLIFSVFFKIYTIILKTILNLKKFLQSFIFFKINLLFFRNPSNNYIINI